MPTTFKPGRRSREIRRLWLAATATQAACEAERRREQADRRAVLRALRHVERSAMERYYARRPRRD